MSTEVQGADRTSAVTASIGAVADVARRLLPDDSVITDRARLRTYECDGLAHYRVTPALVVIPEDADQLAQIVRSCAEHLVPYVARGSGTGLSGGALPHADGVLIVTSRMREITAIRREDQRAVVEPGVINLDVTRAATPQGYYYAPDPSSQQICSIGGNVAENSGGAHCLKYGFTTNHVRGVDFVTPHGSRQRLAVDETVPGASIGGTLAANTSGPGRLATGTMRDLLIGITVVRADGVVAKAGGRVVKNVAGYDIGKLMIGSFGTLAVVTEALFRLHPAPAAQRWVTVPAEDAARAQAVVQSVVHSQTVPAAVEVDWPADGPGSVSVLLEGRAEGVEGRTATVRALLGDTSTESDVAPAGWAAYPWDLAATGAGRSTELKQTFVLSGLHDVLAAAGDAGLALRGSAGAGVTYAALAPGTPVATVQAAVERMRGVCARHGGSVVVLDAPADVKAGVDVWGPMAALDLMRRVKDQFDPDHRLAPGRFVGGI